MEDKLQNIINYGLSLVGIPYDWWREGPCQIKEPMWAENGPEVLKKDIISCNCAGLINLLLRKSGKKLPYFEKSIGGTESYFRYYNNVSEDFDINKMYPIGTLLMKDFIDVNNQGHVAMVIELKGKKSKILQSHIDSEINGVTTFYDIEESNKIYNYEKIVLPENWIL